MSIFRKRVRPPDSPFTHDPSCKILAADPNVEIPWSRLEQGMWRRECVCGTESWYEPPSSRVRLDPFDRDHAGHAGACEFKDVTDPAVLKLALRVREGAGGTYWVVECSACECLWQVPFYTEAVAS